MSRHGGYASVSEENALSCKTREDLMQNAKLEVMAIDDDASVLWERMTREKPLARVLADGYSLLLRYLFYAR